MAKEESGCRLEPGDGGDAVRGLTLIGIPGVFTSPKTLARTHKQAAKRSLSLRFGLGWPKTHLSLHTGQTAFEAPLQSSAHAGDLDPHRFFPIAKVVNAQVTSLEDAPKGYKDFDKGAPKKFAIDPDGIVAKAA